MAFTILQFRTDFPEFASTSPEIFTDAQISFWSGIADLRLDSTRWGDLRDYGIELFTAHNLILSKNDQAAIALGNYSGQANSLKSNKSVGDVSVGLDNQSIMEEKGGDYNLTRYGRLFLRLARQIGIGGAVV
ncbi:DUF4054 domain-containing protein [bacterium]|jgi:hypothetical protein|nr:DUF4054 domain-containing protein [bacterium]